MTESSIANAGLPPATIAATGGQVGDVRIAEPAQFRMALMCFLAAGIGLLACLIAFVLYKLIGLFTNIFFITASAKMLRNNIGRLPVVDRKNARRVVGYLGRPGIMAARLRRLDEERVREPGWIKGRREVKK